MRRPALARHDFAHLHHQTRLVGEAARVLRPGGRLVATCLGKHEHQSAVTPYGHVNLGFGTKDLRRHAEKAGLTVRVCEPVTREKRPPHFEVVTLLAVKP